MVYLVTYKLWRRQASRYGDFDAEIKALNGIEIMHERLLIESEKTALQLYLDLAAHIAIDGEEDPDHLLVAEVTSNTIGSFVVGGNEITDKAIAARLGKARD